MRPSTCSTTWFAGTLPDGFALAATGQRPPFRRGRTARLSGLLSHVDGLTLPVNEAVAGGLEGVKELQVHPHVPDGLRVPVNAGHGSAVLTGRGADGSRC